MFEFEVTEQLSGKGRKGILHTPHGDIQTPVFMPVGTCATVKSLSREDLESIGAQIILANNYHLYLRPGSESVAKLGGIHQFSNWPHPVLTDSGGYQVQSLSPKITDEGVEFTSHLDGTRHLFTPKSAIQSQLNIGADIIMALDDSRDGKPAMDRTHRWLVECKRTWLNTSPPTPLLNSGEGGPRRVGEVALFGIIQGGSSKDLRRQSAEFVVSQNLPGIAIGGKSIGSNPAQTAQTISWVYDLLPHDKPLYTMGVGVRPSDLVAAVHAGADMFDCVAPTRLARCGLLYNIEAPNERINITKVQYKLDQTPIDSNCDCSTCATYPRSYLHHLFKCKELLYYRLASIHNLRVMIRTTENTK